MNSEFDEIKKFIKIGCCPDKFATLMEMLWRYYTVYCPIESDGIRTGEIELESKLKTLSGKRKRQILRSVMDICMEYEKEAFQSGMRMGAQLMIEMLDLKEIAASVSVRPPRNDTED